MRLMRSGGAAAHPAASSAAAAATGPSDGGIHNPTAEVAADGAGPPVDSAGLRLNVVFPRLSQWLDLKRMGQYQSEADDYNKQQNDLAQRKGSWKFHRPLQLLASAFLCVPFATR